MGIITVNIVVNNIGSDTGPFDIYDNYVGLLATNISKQELLSGVSLDIRENATQISVVSKGICDNTLNIPITTFPLSPTPSPTPSITTSTTPSITPSVTETPSKTPSTTPSISISPSIIITRTPSVTPSLSPTNSISITPSVTPSISISNTPSISISVTPSTTPSISISNTPSISISVTPSTTPSISISATPSVTPSTSIGASVTPSVSSTPSISISTTPSITPSISISNTPSITPSITPTRTPTVSPSPSPVTNYYFTTSDTLYSNLQQDCTGFGDLASVVTWAYTVTIYNACSGSTNTSHPNLTFTLSQACDSGNTNPTLTVYNGYSSETYFYNRSNGCTGDFCTVSMYNWPLNTTPC